MLRVVLADRSWTMRASYLSQDRCELQSAVTELARRMQQAECQEHASAQALDAISERKSELLGRLWVDRQAEQQFVDVFSDNDWAGCAKTRPSASSSNVMLGGHLLASPATTQNVAAISSG